MIVVFGWRHVATGNHHGRSVLATACIFLLTTFTLSLSSSTSIKTPLVATASSTTSSSCPLAASSSSSAAAASSRFCHPSSQGKSSDQPVIISPGLKNLGNICYLNSQLECAFHIPRVRQLVLEGGSSEESASVGLISLRKVFTEMMELSSIVSEDSILPSIARTNAVSPGSLCHALGIPIWEQQDAQEFWKLLLPALNCRKLLDLYQGAYEDYIRALDGSQRERSREEAFLDLSLDLVTSTSPGASDADVIDSLKQMFGQPELLSVVEGNGWKPEKGATPIDAEKGARLRALGLPSILQLHMKRFQFNWQTETMTKVNTPCTFPLVLELDSLLAADVTKADGVVGSSIKAGCMLDALYDLQSVVVHAGEYGAGHYYAYVRPDVTRNEWFRFNDDQVTRVDLGDVFQDAFGGSRTANIVESDEEEQESEASIRTGKGIWYWWENSLKWLFYGSTSERSEPSFGYGGPTSNAYILQYVRRRDIPLLYRMNSDVNDCSATSG